MYRALEVVKTRRVHWVRETRRVGPMAQTEYSAKLDSAAFLTILALRSHERPGKRNRSKRTGGPGPFGPSECPPPFLLLLVLPL